MLIHGDNLLALKALESKFAGQVKCIYIDPPYNTGSAFEHYDDNLEHSIWLNLMRPRLEILWNLLDDTVGSLWISIDDSEQAYMRVLCDELFGRHNFVAQNVWQKRYSRENREAIGDVHEYILVYAKDTVSFKEVRNLVPMTEEQAKVYKNPNNDPRGRWRPVPMTAQAGHATPDQFYEIKRLVERFTHLLLGDAGRYPRKHLKSFFLMDGFILERIITASQIKFVISRKSLE